MRRIDKDDFTGQLFLTKNELPQAEFCVAKSIATLAQKLPVDRIESTIIEQELITRFVQPALAPLFEDSANDIFF